MYIKRHIEPVIERIAKRKPVVVITGARQVGKSTMLKEVYKGVRYVALDNPRVREIAKENPSMFFQTHNPPLVVDEIQKAGELLEYIKLVVDERKDKGLFYLTGSQSLKLMCNVSESLAGRAGIIKMLGLSARELNGSGYSEPFTPARAREQAASPANDFDFWKILGHIHTGSFPELHETKGTLKDWSDFYSSYFQAYIEKDVRDIVNIQNESAFIKFVKAAASLTGEMLNYTTIAGFCGKDVKTVQKWIL